MPDVNGEISCSCFGWCRRVAPDGSRTCKHVRLVEMGRADAEALSFHDYLSEVAPKPQQPTTRKDHGKKGKEDGGPRGPGYGQRRLL